jgi:parvulin-like peptidyl-prolyl isomerase
VSIAWKSSVSSRRLLWLGLGLWGLGWCGSWSPVARGQEAKIPAKTASAIKPTAPSAQDSPSQGNATLPAIVAAVNGQTISRDELAKLCLERSGDEVLDNVLHKFVIMQACQAQQLMISQKDVDDEIGRIATKFNLTTNMYLKLIEDQRDITPEQYAADVVWPMLALRGLARDKAEVSQAEVDQAYQAEYGPKVQVRMIAVNDPVKAQELWQQAKAEPAKFKVLAKQFSQDPASASVEGLLPPIRRYGEEDPIEKVAFSLQPDQVSEVFSVGEMFLCLQCVRHLPGSSPSSAQMEEIQHNLRRELEDVKLRKIAESIFQVLREQSSVVKVWGNQELEKQHPGVAALINRQALPLKTLEDECLKRTGPKVLDGAIHRKILEGALKAQAIEITQADLDQEIARAAEYYGMVHPDGRPNVEAWLQEVLREDGTNLELYLSDVVWPTVALKKMIADKVTVTEEDFQKGFEANYGPRAEVLAIVCSNQRTAQEVWQMARDNPTEQFFGELASQYSVEPSSRSNYGKIPPLRRHSGQPTLEAAAFKLQPGELSGIVETGGQYVILRSQGLTTPVVSSPEAVRAELSKDLLEKKQRVAMEKQLEGLLAAAQIDNFLVPKSQLGTAATQASLKMLKEEPATRR